MWHDIFIANKPALLNALDEFVNHLQVFRQIIDQEDSEKMFDWLATARHARRHFGHMLAKNRCTNLILLLLQMPSRILL